MRKFLQFYMRGWFFGNRCYDFQLTLNLWMNSNIITLHQIYIYTHTKSYCMCPIDIFLVQQRLNSSWAGGAKTARHPPLTFAYICIKRITSEADNITEYKLMRHKFNYIPLLFNTVIMPKIFLYLISYWISKSNQPSVCPPPPPYIASKLFKTKQHWQQRKWKLGDFLPSGPIILLLNTVPIKTNLIVCSI